MTRKGNAKKRKPGSQQKHIDLLREEIASLRGAFSASAEREAKLKAAALLFPDNDRYAAIMLSRQLEHAFRFEKTVDGADFWVDVHKRLERISREGR